MTGTISDVERKSNVGARGAAVTNFRITDESGAWFRASAWGETATQVPAGGRVLVEGKLAGRSYTKDGQERSTIELTVGTLEVLGATQAVPGRPSTQPDDDLFSA